MKVVRTENGKTYFCDDIQRLAEELEVSKDVVYAEWEIHDLDMIELARDLGRDKYESVALHTGSKRGREHLVGLTVGVLPYKD